MSTGECHEARGLRQAREALATARTVLIQCKGSVMRNYTIGAAVELVDNAISEIECEEQALTEKR